MKSLKKGNIYCKECNGYGTIELSYKRCSYGSSNDILVKNLVCPQCHGDGQLDWIEQVVGKKSKTYKLGFFPEDMTAGYMSKEIIDEIKKGRSKV